MGVYTVVNLCIYILQKEKIPCKYFTTKTKPCQTTLQGPARMKLSCAQNTTHKTSHICAIRPDEEERFSWCRLCGDVLAVQLMDELEPCCLPGSSCAYTHLAPHLIYSLPDSLDSNPLHEGTHLSGEINLSALQGKTFESSLPQRPLLKSLLGCIATPKPVITSYGLRLFVKLLFVWFHNRSVDRCHQFHFNCLLKIISSMQSWGICAKWISQYSDIL